MKAPFPFIQKAWIDASREANRQRAVAPGKSSPNDNTVDIIGNNNPYPSIGISEALGASVPEFSKCGLWLCPWAH